MPPARPRALDDSRSETSSTVGNIKERNALGATNGLGVSKNKRTNTNVKSSLNNVAVTGAVPAVAPPTLPQTDWNTVSPLTLRTYRTAYRLPTLSSYTHDHADLIYNSSQTALRAPSAVLARRRLRDLKHQRRKATLNGNPTSQTMTKTLKQKEKSNTDADQSSTTNSDNLLKPPSPNHPNAQSLDGTSDISQQTSIPNSIVPPEHIGKQTPNALATAVRKHFNAQQLSEAETVARFTYVVRHTRSREGVNLEGSDGDGHGYWMGSHGREVRRDEGGEVGFRLRFRP